MKFSLKTLILALILLSLHVIPVQTLEESESMKHHYSELEKYREYQANEFQNLQGYLKNYNISEEIAPMTVQLESKDELIIEAAANIPVN